MSYTRPTASAADATWQGTAAYTRPSASAADASFSAGAPGTSGFTTTAFGTPSGKQAQSATGFLSGFVGAPQIAYAPSGFRLTAFGTPFGVFAQTRLAAGFSTTEFGGTSTPLPATGFLATGFGTPVGYQLWRAASIGSVLRFGAPSSPVNLIANAQGFKRSNFGAPFGLRNTASLTNQLCQAFGFTGSFVSTPTSASLQFGSAAGFTGTQLSVPSAVRIQSAVAFASVFLGVPGVNFATYSISLAPVQIGAPALRLTQTAAGFTSLQLPVPNAVSVQSAAALALTYFGTPSATVVTHPDSLVLAQLGAPSLQLTQAVISSAQQAQFGSPSSSRSQTYLTYGIYQGGRVGQPTGFVRFNRTATGFCSAVSGTPSASFRNRAAHIAPGASFGQARLTRASTC